MAKKKNNARNKKKANSKKANMEIGKEVTNQTETKPENKKEEK